MNGRKAKYLRKVVYGDNSLREPRKYKITTFGRILKGMFDKETGEEAVGNRHVFQNTGLRKDYLMLKKMVKENHWTIADIKREIEQKFAF